MTGQTSAESPLLALRNLSTLLLTGVNLQLATGECVALSGASGSGKTLLLRAIADLDPHTGTVALSGRDRGSFPPTEWRRRVGYLPAESQWWGEHVGAHFPAFDEPLFATLGFDPDVLEWEVARCSTGERQRLALLRLLANAPQVLLLDEPTASLDPETAARVEAVIAAYRHEHGAGVLWVSHDPDQARRVAGRRFRIAKGRLEAET